MKGQIKKFSILEYGFEVDGNRYKLDWYDRDLLKQVHEDSTMEDLIGLEVDFKIDLGRIPQGFAGYARVNLESEAL